ncbi:PTS system mannose-specific EIIAB component [compost metagenome]
MADCHAGLCCKCQYSAARHNGDEKIPMTTTANHILLIAHAPLAQALRECALHVFADCGDDVSALDVPPNENPEITLQVARVLLAQSSAERTLVLSDVFGATPSNVAHRLVEGSAARLLVGVNLPMLLRALCYRHEPLEQQAARALAGGQQGMLQVGCGNAPQNQTSRKEHGQDRDHHQQ